VLKSGLYMSRSTVHLLWIVLLCGAASAQTPHRTKTRQAAKPSPAQPLSATTPATTPAEQPVTPEHGPSSPPQVSFQGGQLTIIARNSTMSDVLNAVRQKTGASVDMPAGSGDRVAGQFGPGSPRDVMAQLLNGSHYDYVLLGSPADPRALKKVVLMAKSNGPEPGPVPQANQPQAENENLQAVPEVDTQPTEENSENPGMVETPQEEPQAEQGDQGDQGDQNPPTVKTPEQLLRELQQQQNQQNQSPPPGAPGQPPR
jgi:hypothetical protein